MTIDWANIERVLVVRLRSIGDTVLATPSLTALRRFLPNARIDILLEDWVAPVLAGFDSVDEVLTVGTGVRDRVRTGLELRRRRYDAAFNLHGGTSATWLVGTSGARHRIGYAHYQYSFLYNHLLSSATDLWHREKLHSAEQQLALLGFVGVPVDDRPKSRLTVCDSGRTARVRELLDGRGYALLHPGTAFFTKRWPAGSFARTAEFLVDKGFRVVAISSRDESSIMDELIREAKCRIDAFVDLSLPEITALAEGARVFVGNDSGMAHIAAAVGTPTVVVFGSSNRDHWHPWTDAPNEVVFEHFDCQPCAGYECKEYGDAPCIRTVRPASVIAAIERVTAISSPAY